VEITIRSSKLLEANKRPVVERSDEQDTLHKLRNCLQAAASVITSSSTDYTCNQEVNSPNIGSEFEDVFPSKPSEMMLRWIQANNINPVENLLENRRQDLSAISPLEVEWDSDEEVELEIAKAFLTNAKARMRSRDWTSAEQLLRSYLSRLNDSESLSNYTPAIEVLRIEALLCLVTSTMAQDKWKDAELFMKQKVEYKDRMSPARNSNPMDNLILAEILVSQENHTEALIYGKRAYKAFKKQGIHGQEGLCQSLSMLSLACRDSGLYIEADAYASLYFKCQNREKDEELVPNTTTLSIIPSPNSSQETLAGTLQSSTVVTDGKNDEPRSWPWYHRITHPLTPPTMFGKNISRKSTPVNIAPSSKKTSVDAKRARPIITLRPDMSEVIRVSGFSRSRSKPELKPPSLPVPRRSISMA